MEKNTIKILLANDHLILRSGISDALTTHASHIQVVGEAASYEEILNLLPQIEVDVLMTDDIMPRGEILNMLPLIKKQYPEIKIIINTMQSSETEGINKMMEWAMGWVSFISNEQEYVEAVETVYNGGKHYYKGAS